MNFVIQACTPALDEAAGREFEDLADAIQGLFVMETEDAILFWNWVPIRISYKYDLSVMIDDLLPLLSAMIGTEAGRKEVEWGSNTFRATWAVEWGAGQVRIVGQWDSVAGAYEALLNSRATVEIDRDVFLHEWKMPLRRIVEALGAVNPSITDHESLAALHRIEAAIAKPGSLYRH